MEDTEYRGYIITLNESGYFQVGDMEFPAYDEALDWIDSNLADDVDDDYEETIIPAESIFHKYSFYFVDKFSDDQCHEDIWADSYTSAEKILRRRCDVYRIITCYKEE